MIKSLMLITLVLFSSFSFANVGIDGIDGCDGGTNPAPDGKFYTQDGKICNPSNEDAKKITADNLILKQIENTKEKLCAPYKQVSNEHYDICIQGMNILIYQSYGQGYKVGICGGLLDKKSDMYKGTCDGKKQIENYMQNLKK
ncbi:hypothetical protein KG830_004631 [Salmonella enterica]|nr:hypothetical protein [Salmonella enterica]EBM9948660.1 hypothetical protein [Salmonella enterica subsp. enterica serovar Give]ECI4633043.1 hypothetical protein [Salmonella enterica subsp. enterica serovar Hartford]EDQ6557057.1 hypothetical protein [Salmonella enterica subsp. enterica]EGF6398006.1 hypothetical protein [Salmonella enterica subsp. enterica serovar Rottnest]